MTDRPKLYPGHQHQWTDAHPELFTDALVRCTVCGFEAPRNAAGLDGRMTEPNAVANPANCVARWQRLGDSHLHRCEFMGRHAPPHRCQTCGEQSYRPEQETRTDA